MPRLVRARPKAVEDLPEWARCCPAMINAIQRTGDFTVDIDVQAIHDDKLCIFCDSPIPAVRTVFMIDARIDAAIDLLDLDEGEYIP